MFQRSRAYTCNATLEEKRPCLNIRQGNLVSKSTHSPPTPPHPFPSPSPSWKVGLASHPGNGRPGRGPYGKGGVGTTPARSATLCYAYGEKMEKRHGVFMGFQLTPPSSSICICGYWLLWRLCEACPKHYQKCYRAIRACPKSGPVPNIFEYFRGHVPRAGLSQTFQMRLWAFFDLSLRHLPTTNDD